MNIILSGVPEPAFENWGATERVVREILKDKMGFQDADDIMIQRTHRMGRFLPNARNPRRARA